MFNTKRIRDLERRIEKLEYTVFGDSDEDMEFRRRIHPGLERLLTALITQLGLVYSVELGRTILKFKPKGGD